MSPMDDNWAKRKMKKMFLSLMFVFCSCALFAQVTQQQVTCPKCNGSGSIRETVSKPCSSCNGAKTVIVYDVKDCPLCKGTTKIQVPDNKGNLKTVDCNYSYCNKGKIRVPRTEKCGACGGTGEQNVSVVKKCTKCDGTGEITQ